MSLKVYKNTLVRDNTIDGNMVNECRKAYGDIPLGPMDDVLDLGVNIGGFMAMCAEAKVRSYVGVEPSDENLSVVYANAERFPAIKPHIIKGVVTNSPDATKTFYIRPSKNSPCSSTATPQKVTSNMEQVTVPNVQFMTLMDRFDPTVLKMDIEGAEIAILEDLNEWKWSTLWVAMEIHGKGNMHRLETELLPKVFSKNYELVRASPVHGFKKKDAEPTWSHFGQSAHSALFGFDLLYRRK